MVEAIDPGRRHLSYAGVLDLPQLWRLPESARLLVCLDSGVSHMARLARTPCMHAIETESMVASCRELVG
jgi:ADP-heptose:LPS heptosyltransferase